MTLQEQLTKSGLVAPPTPAELATKRAREGFDSAMLALQHSMTVQRSWVAGLDSAGLAQYHRVLRERRLYVVAVSGGSIKFARRPGRSYSAFCRDARRRYNREQSRSRRQR